jgi:hypothetical protein
MEYMHNYRLSFDLLLNIGKIYPQITDIVENNDKYAIMVGGLLMPVDYEVPSQLGTTPQKNKSMVRSMLKNLYNNRMLLDTTI